MSAFKQGIKKQLEGVKADYANDLAAMSHESLAASPGGSARTGYDFSYEIVVVNDRWANGMLGKSNGPWPFDGWAMAPDDFKSPEKAVAEVNRSTDSMIAAWDSLSDDEAVTELTSASGAKSTPLDMILSCIQHMSYHDAQLNYIQALNGDMEVHWK